MFPHPSSADSPDLVTTRVVPSGYFTIGQMAETSDFTDLTFRESRFGVAFTGHTSLTTFRNHISDVIGAGSKKKVVRIDAFSNVTAMQNAKVMRNRTSDEFIHQPVCSDLPILIDQFTIAIGAFVGNPEPTVRGSVDLRPKPYIQSAYHA